MKFFEYSFGIILLEYHNLRLKKLIYNRKLKSPTRLQLDQLDETGNLGYDTVEFYMVQFQSSTLEEMLPQDVKLSNFTQLIEVNDSLEMVDGLKKLRFILD